MKESNIPIELEELIGEVKVLTETTEIEPTDKFKSFGQEMPVVIQKALNIDDVEAVTKSKARSKGMESDHSRDLYSVFDVVEPTYNLTTLGKLYDTSAYHAAAVDAKIDNSLGLGYEFILSRKAEKIKEAEYRKADNSKLGKARIKFDESVEDLKDELTLLLEQLTHYEELETVLKKCMKDRLTMGNGYIEIGRDPKTGVIGYIGHVRPQDIRIRRDRQGFIQYAGNRPVFFRNFGDRKTPDPFQFDSHPNELIHYKSYSPVDEYYGVPEIVAALPAVYGIEHAQRYNMDYFEHKAVPRYIIKTRGIKMTPDQKDSLLKFFETTLKGVNHRTLLIPLPTGVDKDITLEPVEARQQDSSFGSYIKDNIAIILGRHRVPMTRLGISQSSSSRAESMESDRVFKATVCQPEQRVIEKKVNAILKEFTDALEFKLTEYILTDDDTQSQIDERNLRWGVYTPDEIRLQHGQPARPDGMGNEPLDQLSLAKAGVSNAQQSADQKEQTYRNRTRDQDRQSNTTDDASSSKARNSAGQGRK